jgi:hypothetical protein
MSLKEQFIERHLARKHKELKRHIRPVNLSQAKTAGILWKIDDRDVFKMLLKQLKEKGIKVSSLCFADQPGSVQGEAIYSLSDFSFFGQLQNKEIANFIGKDFDVLIDISLAKGAEFQFVRALSKAKFKTGWSDAVPDYFDLSIDIRNRKEPSYLAGQLIHYLSEMNKPPQSSGAGALGLEESHSANDK